MSAPFDISGLRQIWLEEYGRSISEEQAHELAGMLLGFFGTAALIRARLSTLHAPGALDDHARGTRRSR